MNNKYITIIVVAVIVLGGAYFLTNKAESPSTTNEVSGGNENSGTGSLKDLLSRNGNYYCTVSIEDQNFSASGEVFMAGEDLRVDFLSYAADQAVSSSMIQTGGTIYTWTNMFNQGFKFPVVEVEAGGPGPDLSVNVSYDCEPWTEVDRERFVLPEGIEFVEPQQ